MIEILFTLFIIALLLKPTGEYIARVMLGEPVLLTRVFGRVERECYRLLRVSPADEMSWRGYALNMLVFHFFCFLFIYTIFLTQAWLPLNPQGFIGLPAESAFIAAMSFITDTNWQSYNGEQQLSYFSQMVGISVQNFLAPASAIGIAMVMCRGLKRKQTDRIGNFWVDMVRSILYLLLPVSFIVAVILLSQGAVETFGEYVTATTLEGGEQLIAVGPVASQLAIKMVGANGGGFFGVNAAHPFSNPNAITNFVQVIVMLLFPAAFLYAFGAIVGDRRQGLVLLAVVLMIFLPLTFLSAAEEMKPHPAVPDTVDSGVVGNLEGKELRIGAANSAFWTASATSTSNGSVNSTIMSSRPLASLTPLILIQITGGKFAGLGIGLCCMIVFVIIAVFIGSLMVGRNPQYMGKRLEPFDIKMASLIILIPTFFTLVGTALAIGTEAGREHIYKEGIEGFIGVLYGFASASSNNGSAYGAVNFSNPFYDTALGICIFAGRFLFCVPILAMAGSLAGRNISPSSNVAMPTHTLTFCILLLLTVVLVDIMSYLPTLALGPIVEQLHLLAIDDIITGVEVPQ